MTSFSDSGSCILQKFKFLYFWNDLAKIGLRGEILGTDSKSEAIYYIRGRFQVDVLPNFFVILPLTIS